MSSSSSVNDPQAPAPTTYEAGMGNYFPKPPNKRKDARGKYDVSTPKSLIDLDENYVAVLTVAENRHPNEDQLIEHYAKQLVGKKDGSYDPMEDPPIILRDLLPTFVIVVNKVFTRHEVTIGGEKCIKEYCEKVCEHVDFDVVPVMCGRPAVFPLHPLTPMQHRDPIYNQQMQGFYKQHDKSAQELIERVVQAQKEAEEKVKAQKEKEDKQAQKAIEASSSTLDEEDDKEEEEEKKPVPVPVEKKGGARRVEKK